jgi:hypothetical protein
MMRAIKGGWMFRALRLFLLFAAACTGPGSALPLPDARPAADGPLGFDAPIAVDARPPVGDAPIVDRDAGTLIFDPCVSQPRTGYEPTGLSACCEGTGPAHCVPPGEVLPELVAFLSACPAGGVCMPDPIIRAGGTYQPATCTSSVLNGPGACLSKCIPLVADNPLTVLLRQDSCGDGELCIPCTNPVDQTPTGACNLIDLICPDVPPDGGVADAGVDAATVCPHRGPPILDPETQPECSPACPGARCIPAFLVPAAQQTLLSACPADFGAPGLCAPDELIETGGNFVPMTCRSIANAEGRCLSTCLPDVAEQAGFLPRDVCDADERCVPCYDPTSSMPTTQTGACSLACDSPTKPPVVLTCPYTGPAVIDPAALPECGPACGGAHCLPSSFVPASLQPLLAACTDGFCVPDPIIATAGQKPPPTCRSVAGVEGRCMSNCLPLVQELGGVLPRDSCGPLEVCAPCFDPTSAEPTAPTGACNIACDEPVEPPLVLSCPWTGDPVIEADIFPPCAPVCGGSHCVPEALVPDDLESQLAACPGGFCTPDSFVESAGNFVPQSCHSVAGAEGRCLSTCLPDVAAQAALLPRDVCGIDEECVPCFDPTSGDPTATTGACSLGCDMPHEGPIVLSCPWGGPPVVDPASFPACSPACGGSHCVPGSFIPEDQQGLLAECPGGFCAPDPIIASANNYVPQSCTSIAGSEGRCLSTCLPGVAELADFLPAVGCPAGTKCAPCYDPTSPDPTAATGACSLGCDAPKQPPLVLSCPWTGPAVIDPARLPACDPACGGAHCLPDKFVPDDQRDLLAPCPGGFCAPDPLIQTANNFVPPTCTSIAGAEGRCLSTCLPDVAAQNLLPQSTCAANHRCVPCFDPTSGDPTAATGACSLACDMPHQPPVVLSCPWTGPAVIDPAKLPACDPVCDGARCLPGSYVPDDLADFCARAPAASARPSRSSPPPATSRRRAARRSPASAKAAVCRAACPSSPARPASSAGTAPRTSAARPASTR